MREFKKLPLELFIGYDIEQNSRVIELDASEMVEKYPSGILQLVCKPGNNGVIVQCRLDPTMPHGFRKVMELLAESKTVILP